MFDSSTIPQSISKNGVISVTDVYVFEYLVLHSENRKEVIKINFPRLSLQDGYFQFFATTVSLEELSGTDKQMFVYFKCGLDNPNFLKTKTYQRN